MTLGINLEQMDVLVHNRVKGDGWDASPLAVSDPCGVVEMTRVSLLGLEKRWKLNGLVGFGCITVFIAGF